MSTMCGNISILSAYDVLLYRSCYIPGFVVANHTIIHPLFLQLNVICVPELRIYFHANIADSVVSVAFLMHNHTNPHSSAGVLILQRATATVLLICVTNSICDCFIYSCPNHIILALLLTDSTTRLPLDRWWTSNHISTRLRCCSPAHPCAHVWTSLLRLTCTMDVCKKSMWKNQLASLHMRHYKECIDIR